MTSDLEIRRVRPDEVDRFIDLSHYAFFALDGASRDQRVNDYFRREVPGREALVGIVDGTIVAETVIYSFGIWIDGVRFPTGGIASVATAPDQLRRGFARRLLEGSLAVMRNDLGLSLSTMYATIYPLYRDLGWTLVEDAHRYVGAPAAFRPASLLPVDGGGRIVQRAASLEDIEILEPVYRQFARPRSGYLDRPRWYWEDHVLRYQRSSQPRWIALWYGSDDQLSAYVLYTLNFSPDERQLRVYELLSVRPEGYQALLTFLSSHHLWDKVVIEDGHDVPWKLLVTDPYSLDVKTPIKNNHFLLRIVDLQQAVTQTVPSDERQMQDITLRVYDRAAPWNDGVWAIGQRDGRWMCDRGPSQEADAFVDISTVAPLMAGSLSVRRAIETGLLHASNEAQRTLSILFARECSPHSKDHF